LCSNDSREFPGAWGKLAGLLLETQEQLARAGRAGARREDVVDLSRAVRHALSAAPDDVDRAVAAVGRIALDARSLVAADA